MPPPVVPAILAVVFAAAAHAATPPTAAACALLPAVRAEALRKHLVVTGEAAPFPPNGTAYKQAKHEPVVEMEVAGEEGRGRVVVGAGPDAYHPATRSTDPGVLHYIEAIYVEDQDGRVVAAGEYLATAAAEGPTTLIFDVPAGVTAVTAYALCNKHGLHQSERVAVPVEIIATARSPPPCKLAQCAVDMIGVVDGVCEQYAVLEASARFEHTLTTGEAGPFAPSVSNTKHTPYITVVGDNAVVTVGLGTITGDPTDPVHPTAASPPHYISAIYVKDARGVVVAAGKFTAVDGVPPRLAFVIPKGVGSITAYALCNIHGLFQSATLAVEEADTDDRTAPAVTCGLATCGGEPTSRPACAAFTALRADAVRKHRAVIGDASSSSFTPTAANTKHTPFITLLGEGRARVTVGKGTVSGNASDPVHPTTFSADPAGVHFIELVYVVDQNDVVVAAAQFTAGDGAPPALEFAVPAGTVQLTAYALCNIHGLYASHAVGGGVAITRTSGEPFACALVACGPSEVDPPGSVCPQQLEAVAAEAKRIHLRDFGEVSPFAPTDANQKHTPYVVFDAPRAVATATVFIGIGGVTRLAGDPVHPTNPSADPAAVHYIETIYVRDQDGRVFAAGKPAPDAAPPVQMRFAIPTGVRELTAYALCNIHGLYRSGVYEVDEVVGEGGVAAAVPACGFAPCGGVSMFDAIAAAEDAAAAAGRCRALGALRARAEQVHARMFARTDASNGIAPFGAADVPSTAVRYFTPTTANTKHTPYLAIAGGTARVSVGKGTVTRLLLDAVHPTTASTAPGELHYISMLYVVDNTDTVIAAATPSSTVAQPVLVFEVPENTTALRAFALCNVHGLYAGYPRVLSAGERGEARGNARECRVRPSCTAAAEGDEVSHGTPQHCGSLDLLRTAAIVNAGVEFPDAFAPRARQDVPAVRAMAFTINTAGVGRLTFPAPAAPTAQPSAAAVSSDADTTPAAAASPSYIAIVYIEDQDGRVVAAGNRLPWGAYGEEGGVEGVARPFSFAMPRTATSATAFVYHTALGLVDIGTVVVGADAWCTVAMPSCRGNPLPASVVDTSAADEGCFLQTLRAEAERRHLAMHPGTADAWAFPPGTSAKHQPYITFQRETGMAVVTVGLGTVSKNASDPVHPTALTADPARLHYIDTIYVVDTARDVVVAAGTFPDGGIEGTPPALRFEMPAGVAEVEAFALCNVHGLYRGERQEVPAVAATGVQVSPPACRLVNSCSSTAAGTVDAKPDATPVPAPAGARGASCTAFTVLVAEAARLQLADFARATPFAPDATNLKHTPYLTLREGGLLGTVTVGLGTVSGDPADPVHPTTPSRNPMNAHFISLLYVVDETDTVIAARRMFAEGGAPPRLEFAVPARARALRPYAYCNIHGWFQGVAVAVDARPALSCVLEECRGPNVAGDGAGGGNTVVLPPPLTPSPPGDGAVPACTPSDIAGYACMAATALEGVTLHWTYTPGAGAMDVAVRSVGSTGWLAVAFPARFGVMSPADAVIFTPGVEVGEGAGEPGAEVGAYRLAERTMAGVVSSASAAEALGLAAASGEVAGDSVILRFTRNTVGMDGAVGVNIARDLSRGALAQHSLSQVAGLVTRFAGGAAESVAIEDITDYRLAHAWLMLVAWCYLAPAGVICKRYGKTIFGMGNSLMRRQGLKLGGAFVGHVATMLAAVVCVLTAGAIALAKFTDRGTPHPHHHDGLGYSILAAAVVMPFLGLVLPVFCPRAYDPGRAAARLVHAGIGRSLLVAAYIQVFTGIDRASALDVPGANALYPAALVGVAISVWTVLLLEFFQRQYLLVRRARLSRRGGLLDKVREGDLASHGAQSKDPWLAVDGRVYAISTWAQRHPGGMAVLLENAGGDASDAWRVFQHSQQALKTMEAFFIGELEDERMASAMDLTDGIARALMNLDLVAAGQQIAVSEGRVPNTLLDALTGLLDNLESYLPFLPQALVAAAQEPERPPAQSPAQARLTRTIESNPPTMVAIAFTDIQSSTQLWEASSQGMKVGLDLHNLAIREVVARVDGYEVKTIGDAFMVAFLSAKDGFRFALGVQEALVEVEWPQALLESHELCAARPGGGGASKRLWAGPRVRIGVHWGDVDAQRNPITGRCDFFGNAVNKAARVEAAGVGGCSAVTEEVLDAIPKAELEEFAGVEYINMGRVPLKGVSADKLSFLTLILPATLVGRKELALRTLCDRGSANAAGGARAPRGTSRRTQRMSLSRSPREHSRTLSERHTNGDTMTSNVLAQARGYAANMGTIVRVHMDFSCLQQSLLAPKVVDSVIVPMLEAAARTEGICQTLTGGTAVLAWNLSRPCAQHVVQSLKFLVALHDVGYSSMSLFDVWGRHLHCGVASGWMVFGRTGTDTQQFCMFLGGPLALAQHACDLARAHDIYAVTASLGNAPDAARDASVADALRLLDRQPVRRELPLAPPPSPLPQHLTQQQLAAPVRSPALSGANTNPGVVPEYVQLYELNVNALSNAVDTWGFALDGPGDASWGVAFNTSMAAALEAHAAGNAEAFEKSKADVLCTLATATAARVCGKCARSTATLLCEDCGIGVCRGCAAAACVHHRVDVHAAGSVEGTAYIQDKLALLTAKSAEHRVRVYIELDMPNKPDPQWLGRRDGDSVSHMSRRGGGHRESQTSALGPGASPGMPRSPQAVPVPPLPNLTPLTATPTSMPPLWHLACTNSNGAFEDRSSVSISPRCDHSPCSLHSSFGRPTRDASGLVDPGQMHLAIQ